MFPNLFSVGPLTMHTYGLMAALGVAAAITVTILSAKKEGFTTDQVMDMGFIMILSAIIGARLLYVLIKLPYYIKNPLEIFELWHGGLVFSGGVIAVIISMAFYLKRHNISFWKTGDLWAPGVAIGQAIGRIGCFMAGCCYGKPTHCILGVTFTNPDSLAPRGVPIHPTQLYSSAAGFIIFVILIILKSKKRFNGQVILWFFILHSTARLAIERFRGDYRGMLPGTNMTVTQFIALMTLVTAVILLFVKKHQSETTETE